MRRSDRHAPGRGTRQSGQRRPDRLHDSGLPPVVRARLAMDVRRTSRATGRRWAFPACRFLVAVATSWASVCLFVASPVQGQAPLVLNTIVEEANEALFDGRYVETIRLTNKALDILKSPAKRRMVRQLGGDWLLAEGLVQGLQAEALLRTGSVSLAIARLETAARKAESRRMYYVRSGVDPSMYFLYEAHLRFLQGDIAYRPPTYGRYARDPRAAPVADEDAGANNKRACRHYNEATDILERLLKLDPTPSENVLDGHRLIAQRLLVRLAVSMARAELAAPPDLERDRGYPQCLEQRAVDAEALITRAHDVLNTNEIYREYLRPTSNGGGRRGLSYRDFQKYQESKKKKGGTDGITEQDILALKRLFYHAISDYVLVNNLRAEIECIKEVASESMGRRDSSGAFDPSVAELLYMTTKQFLQEQFLSSHPILSDLEISLARWFCHKSMFGERDRERTDLPPYLLAQKISYARDALFTVCKIRAAAEGPETSMMPATKQELLWLEAAAIRSLLDVHARSPFLDADSHRALNARYEAIPGEASGAEAGDVADAR